jgi:glycosyltransferase involved in cell wall biosynthesis
MKIAIVTDAWHPQVNGVVTTLTATAGTLEKQGHEILLITPELFRTFPCPTYPEIRLSKSPGRKVRELLDAFGPDAIHIATEAPLGWAARKYCLRNGLRFTTSYHTRFPEYVRMRIPIPLWISYALVQRFHAPASRTMVATENLRTELMLRGFRNLVLWSRGVDTDIFQPRPRDFLQDKRPILLYAGRVAVEKNIKEFLAIDIPGTKYVIGDGPAFNDLKRQYPEAVFPGFKIGVELAQYMAAADVFVFPSRTDTFGVVMLEANACGLPVAAHPVTGPETVIAQGRTGWLAENLGEAIARALQLNPTDCVAHARRYSWEKCTAQFLANLAVPARLPATEPAVRNVN